jgi:hypothetical protein
LPRSAHLGKSQVDISFPEIEKFDALPPATVEGVRPSSRSWRAVQQVLRFCIVPYTRGEEVSRPFDDVLTEVAGLAAQGVKEVTLLGQNVNAYRGAMAAWPGRRGSGRPRLLIEYIAEMPGIERIRYTTSHPREVAAPDRGLRQGAEAGLASAPAGPVGFRPRPGGDEARLHGARIQVLVRKLRAARPDISLSSDFIIGFPGETPKISKRRCAWPRNSTSTTASSSSTARAPARRRPTWPTDITFGIGPAGTGKTYLAVAKRRCDALRTRPGQAASCWTRPAVEAGERLGFLPGDLAQKVDPYLRPLYDALYDLMGFDKVAKLFERSRTSRSRPGLHARPHAESRLHHPRRGAEHHAEQMKMFLTRIGIGSRAVVTGDVTQVDLPRGQKSGLVEARAS